MDFQKDNKDTREEEKGFCLSVSAYISNKPVTHVLCTYYHYSHATDKEQSKILEEQCFQQLWYLQGSSCENGKSSVEVNLSKGALSRVY